MSPCYHSFLQSTKSYHSKKTHIIILHAQKKAEAVLLSVQRIPFSVSLLSIKLKLKFHYSISSISIKFLPISTFLFLQELDLSSYSPLKRLSWRLCDALWTTCLEVWGILVWYSVYTLVEKMLPDATPDAAQVEPHEHTMSVGSTFAPTVDVPC